MDVIFFISSLLSRGPEQRKNAGKLPRRWFPRSVSQADKMEVILNNKLHKPHYKNGRHFGGHTACPDVQYARTSYLLATTFRRFLSKALILLVRLRFHFYTTYPGSAVRRLLFRWPSPKLAIWRCLQEARVQISTSFFMFAQVLHMWRRLAIRGNCERKI